MHRARSSKESTASAATADVRLQPVQPACSLRCRALCRRKQRQLQVQLQEVGDEALQERLEGAAERPASPPFRLSSLIQVHF